MFFHNSYIIWLIWPRFDTSRIYSISSNRIRIKVNTGHILYLFVLFEIILLSFWIKVLSLQESLRTRIMTQCLCHAAFFISIVRWIFFIDIHLLLGFFWQNGQFFVIFLHLLIESAFSSVFNYKLSIVILVGNIFLSSMLSRCLILCTLLLNLHRLHRGCRLFQ